MAFSISGLPSSVREGDGAFSITIGGLSGSRQIDWEIVPSGRLPVSASDFTALSGSFTAGNGSYDFNFGITNDALAEFAKSFTIVFTANGETVRQDIVLSDGDGRYASSRNREFSGNTDQNIVTFGSDDDYAYNGLAGDDIYRVTSAQYGDVVITDTNASSYNLIGFDFGVSIKDLAERKGGFGGQTVLEVRLTLATDAVITIKSPASSAQRFQIGDGEAMDYTAFKTEIGSPTSSAPYEVTTYLTNPSGIAASSRNREFSGNTDQNIVTFGSDDDYAYNGLAGDDIYRVTSAQYGDVVITDTNASSYNLIGFDFGVSIKDLAERKGGFGGQTVLEVRLTLATDAVITIKSPASSAQRFQIGDGEVMDYAAFKDEIGSPTNSDPYTIDFPSSGPVRFAEGARAAIADAFTQKTLTEPGEGGSALGYNSVRLPRIADLFDITPPDGGPNEATIRSRISLADVTIQHGSDGAPVTIPRSGDAESFGFQLRSDVISASNIPANLNGELILTFTYTYDADGSGTDHTPQTIGRPVTVTITITPTADAYDVVGATAQSNINQIDYFDRTGDARDHLTFTDTGLNLWFMVRGTTTYIMTTDTDPNDLDQTGDRAYRAIIHNLTDLNRADFTTAARNELSSLTRFTVLDGNARNNVSTDQITEDAAATLKSGEVIEIKQVFYVTQNAASAITITHFNAATDKIIFFPTNTSIKRHEVTTTVNGNDVLVRATKGTTSTGDDIVITLTGLGSTYTGGTPEENNAVAQAAILVEAAADAIGTSNANKLIIGQKDTEYTDTDAIELSHLFENAVGAVRYAFSGTGTSTSGTTLSGNNIQFNGANTGLVFNPETGTITGEATQSYVLTFTITATQGGKDGRLETDEEGGTATTDRITLQIKSPPTLGGDAETTENEVTGEAAIIGDIEAEDSPFTQFDDTLIRSGGVHLFLHLPTGEQIPGWVEFINAPDGNILIENFGSPLHRRAYTDYLFTIPSVDTTESDGGDTGDTDANNDNVAHITIGGVGFAILPFPYFNPTNRRNVVFIDADKAQYHFTIGNFKFNDADGDRFVELQVKNPDGKGQLLYKGKSLTKAAGENNELSDIGGGWFALRGTGNGPNRQAETLENFINRHLTLDRTNRDGEFNFAYRMKDSAGGVSKDFTFKLDLGDIRETIKITETTIGEAAAPLYHLDPAHTDRIWLPDGEHEVWYYQKTDSDGAIVTYFLKPFSGSTDDGAFYARVKGIAANAAPETVDDFLFSSTSAIADLTLTKVTIADFDAKNPYNEEGQTVIIPGEDAFGSSDAPPKRIFAANSKIFLPDVDLVNLEHWVFNNNHLWILRHQEDAKSSTAGFPYRIGVARDEDDRKSTTIFTKDGFEINADWHLRHGDAAANEDLDTHTTAKTIFVFAGTNFGQDTIKTANVEDEIWIPDFAADKIKLVSTTNYATDGTTTESSFIKLLNTNDRAISNLRINLEGDEIPATILGRDNMAVPNANKDIEISGSSVGETIVGSNLGETINGNGGDDVIRGLDGNDVINGGGGNDVLMPHRIVDVNSGNVAGQRDIVTGGAGSDIFLISLLQEGPTGQAVTVITDFKRSENDKIALGIYYRDYEDFWEGTKSLVDLGLETRRGDYNPTTRAFTLNDTGNDTALRLDINGTFVSIVILQGVTDSLQASDFRLFETVSSTNTLELYGSLSSDINDILSLENTTVYELL